jgi:hypothetical protein
VPNLPASFHFRYQNQILTNSLDENVSTGVAFSDDWPREWKVALASPQRLVGMHNHKAFNVRWPSPAKTVANTKLAVVTAAPHEQVTFISDSSRVLVTCLYR